MDGLYNKYRITKNNGDPVDPDADYFVLRLDADVHSLPALVAYALSVQDHNPRLAYELMAKITAQWGDHPDPPVMLCQTMDALDLVTWNITGAKKADQADSGGGDS